MTAVDLLVHDALAIAQLGADVIDATDIGTHAVEYAIRNWPVFPLRGKVPAIPGGRGMLDATTDVATIVRWWGGRFAGANIGGRLPQNVIVIDIDPRNGGGDTINDLQSKCGELPKTLTSISGRGDGGRHLFYRRPHGELSSKALGPGVDLKTYAGYVVLPPSIHPDSGQPYTRVEHPVASPPNWLTDLLRIQPRATAKCSRSIAAVSAHSIADTFSRTTSWADILEPHGWRCLDADPDGDRARWRHPSATAPSSATVRHGCLFVYSPNTPFEVTEASNPHGYTRFRAYAVLNHDGDLRAAHRSLRKASLSS